MASKLQTKIINEMEKQGYYVINIIRSNKNGIADLLCLKSGEKPLFIECKEKNDSVKPIQTYRGKEVLKFGCEFIIIKEK